MDGDEAAVRRCLAGEREAFADLVERYKRPLYTLSLRLVGDPGLAEDVVQETFLRAYRGLGGFRLGSPLAPWLYRIATNLCHDVGRSRARPVVSAEDADLERHPDPGDRPDEVLARREAQERVRRAVAELPEMYRMLIVLAHQQGLSYEEICQVTGEPLTIVKNRLFRARQMLKQSLAPYYQEGRAPEPPRRQVQRPGLQAPSQVEGGVSSEV